MAYPDWVLEYKKKGFYLNKVNDEKYRLYRGHSKRIKGTNKVKRIVDEYIGTITKNKGLTKAKRKVKGEITVKRSGCFSLVRFYCLKPFYSRIRKSIKIREIIFIWSYLLLIYGDTSFEIYNSDWISEYFAHVNYFPLIPEYENITYRAKTLLEKTLNLTFKKELKSILRTLSRVYMVRVNDEWMLSKNSDKIAEYEKKYLFNLREWAD